MADFKFVDLFAWVWWFHLAFHNLWGVCVAWAEIDKKARETYKLNFQSISPKMFKNKLFFKDITKVKWKEVPDHDIMCWGFPCQAFSIAWHRKWFEDTRWTLFFDVARLLKKKKPKVVFLENVKNLQGHDKGKTFKVIIDTLEDLGYHVHYKILNSSEYGWIQQNRERIYIIGFRDKKAYKKFIFPTKIEYKQKISDLYDKKVDQKYYYKGKNLYDRIKDDITKKDTFYQWRRKYVRENKSGVCPTLTANMWTWWHNVPIILDDKWIRKLTPRETFTLQAYPKDYKLPDMADSHLYKQAWNSVTVTMIQRIWENILRAQWIID